MTKTKVNKKKLISNSLTINKIMKKQKNKHYTLKHFLLMN